MFFQYSISLVQGLLKENGRLSKAARQWNISDPANMHNSLELNKISQESEYPALKYIEPDKKAARELRGIKVSFRKKVIEPLEPLALPINSLAPALSGKRHQSRLNDS